MLKGLWRLIWLEIVIFVREPLGLIGTVLVPALVFVGLGRTFGGPNPDHDDAAVQRFAADVPVLVATFIAISAVLSLVTIIAIYREGGILKRLRATPLTPLTILTAHVVVKLLMTAGTLGLALLLGARYYAIPEGTPLLSFTVALLASTLSILAFGFLLASVVPTARFAQPIGALVLYPMLGVSGLFLPVESLHPVLRVLAQALPLTHGVSLLRGIWAGEGWMAHLGDVAALGVIFAACCLLASRVFRWE
ncbi:MAG TPA: ABC transporter permease [Vicinamibacterales bacterium]